MRDPTRLDAHAAARALSSGKLSAADLCEAYLARIERFDDALHCYVTVTAHTARAEAAASDARRRAHGALGPLDGIPLALKDNIDMAGVPTTNGLALQRIPDADAEVVRRLRSTGAVILGKLNMHEGALGATNDNPHHGATHNPWHLGYTPGGSSGGSGAALAARLGTLALGTDTLGSVRIPAAYCGMLGLLPTTGLVSTRGVVPLSFSLDHVGLIGRSLRDLITLLGAVSGFDPGDPRSLATAGRMPSRPPPAALPGSLRVGTLANFDTVDVEPQVRSAVDRALHGLRAGGAVVRSVALPGIDVSRVRRAGLLVAEAEAAVAQREVLAAQPECASAAFRGMLAHGATVPAARLVEAAQTVRAAGHALRRAFDTLDVVISPTTPQVAFPFSHTVPVNQADLTALANCAGCPALSMPCGCDGDGLPVGLQIIGPALGERRVLAIAAAIARGLPHLALAPDPPPLPAPR